MKSDFRLYIGTNLVELTDNPAILYTYQIDDFSNPTSIKNSFSKTITVQGTPANDRIFGQYWNVERRVGSGGNNAGVDFNASKKAPFTILINNEVYESGYVKLDRVNRVGNAITYDISLFGGLGDFFHKLSTNENTGDKLKLSDLDYTGSGSTEFDFTVSASTLVEAWSALKNGTAGKWQHINFVPSYNGLPSDFDSKRVIINLAGTDLPSQEGQYGPKNGCVIAELPQEMTEWEIRDIRSYLQRPAIKMSSIISACTDPMQNGGYTVVLDPDFFGESNDYYSKTWVTLPLMQDLEYSNDEQILSGSNLISLTTTGETGQMMYQDLVFDIGDYTNATAKNILIEAQIGTNTDGVDAQYSSFRLYWRPRGDGYHSGWDCLGSLFVQVIALNGDAVVGASDAYNLTSPVEHNGHLVFGNNSVYSEGNRFKPYLDRNILNIIGTFHEDGFRGYHKNTPETIPFNIIGINSPITSLKMVYYWGATDDKIRRFGEATLFEESEESSLSVFYPANPHPFYLNDPFRLSADITYNSFRAVLGDSLGRTGTKVNKQMLLNTEYSPAEYLLSYCKMFGLYFSKDIDENIIRIETRKTFYDRNNIKNLNDVIDREKDYKITPIAFDTKWYELSQEMDETDYSKKYESSKGVQYGCKILNTGYEFNTEKKPLLEDNCLRSGIECLERSKNYTAYNDDATVRPWMTNGLRYDLYYGPSAYTVTVPLRDSSTLLPLNENEGMRYYDVFPKLQFHDADGASTDGNNVLVFFSGFKSVTSGRSNPLNYFITDDGAWQTLLNEGTPCWFFTTSEYLNGDRVATKVNEFPVFERYLTYEGSGKVGKSLDFGTPQELYIPDYSLTEDANIYSNFWKTYLTDLFDPDTKILECYVKVDGRVTPEWMRRFYWFDNSIWRLNKVSDWDISSYDTTLMEFVKVNDLSDYTSVTQVQPTRITLSASSYTVGNDGGSITLSVTISNGGSWRLSATDGAVCSRTEGTGNGTISVTLPANNGDSQKVWYFTVSSLDGATARVSVSQNPSGFTDFSVSPSNILFPASGGSVFVDILWKNKGNDFLARSRYSVGPRYAEIARVDIVAFATQNKVEIKLNPNTGKTVLHNVVRLEDELHGIVKEIGIDQLPQSYDFTSEGGSEVDRIQYGSGVTFEGLPYWASVNDGEDGEYTISTRPNYYTEENRATITVRNRDGSSARVEIKQDAGEGVAPSTNDSVIPKSLSYASTGGTKYITVTADYGWTAISPAGVTLSQDSGDGGATQVGVTLGDNASSSEKTYAVTFSFLNSTGGTTPKTLTISQAGVGTKSLTVTPTTLSAPASGGDYTLVLNYTNRGTDLVSFSFPTAVLPMPISWTGETGTTTLRVNPNYSASARTLTVTFSGDGVTAQTVVTQDGRGESASVSEGTVYPPASGSSIVETITSNTNWSARTDDSWIVFSPVSGISGVENLTVTTASNTGASERTGYVYIESIQSGELLATITVYQSGFAETITVSPSTIYFDSEGGTATFTITSNTSWTIE